MNSTHLLKSIAGVFLLSLALFSLNVHAADAKTGKASSKHEKVLIQVSDDDAKKWNLALNNAKNLQQAMGADKVNIEVVVYGPGIGMLKFDSAVAGRVDEAINAGVKIVACENTMKAQKLEKTDMMSTIDYVPAGVVEIVKKQRAGYAYLRP